MLRSPLFAAMFAVDKFEIFLVPCNEKLMTNLKMDFKMVPGSCEN